ncbi:hypothetical protein PUMCH_000665 [Australozyma saopauloensis]|uniref:Vacuolar protein sorting-associated protein n=1 Tax=Australozyma saopauloensis TaxID=291208 RepID=A0AAX4H4C4_9ASCO|nr:hypothetical protein PUMCH_000665 [[Candida] saopauloensis]
MFESIVATLLNRLLGAYIENFDSKQLNIGIWSGDVRLKNLKLKKESLDKFKLPLDVKFGHLGELTLQIPWSNLKGKPVKVIVEDVYLLAAPIILTEYDADDDERREQQLKQDRLRDLEAVQSTLNSNPGLALDLSGNESFTESLITKIVDNVQVTIKNIHIRYEDEGVLTENPYAVGATLLELSALSTDENWEPSFIAITQSFTRKLLLLKEFALYMESDASSIYTSDHVELLQRLQCCFLNHDGSYEYLLKPVSGEGHLVVHKAGATSSHPHIRAELFFDEFGIDFNSLQYRDILWTALKLQWYEKTWKFRKLRPKKLVEEAPREWFVYAAKLVLNEIHTKNYKWSWEYFKTRRDQRKLYIDLWKQKLVKGYLLPEQEIEFENLEKILSYEDIKFYRSLTRLEIRLQNLVTKQEQASAQAQASKGWFSWWSGAPAQVEEHPDQAPADEGGLNLTLTDEQRQALYETIDYDENQTSEAAINVPKDRVLTEVFVNLKKAGFSLRANKNSSSLAELTAEGCRTQFYQRSDSFLANFQLEEFKIEDGTPKPLYKHIVSVKQAHTHGAASITSGDSDLEQNEPFFRFSFENNPLDGSADSKLLAELKSMTIFYNYIFADEVMKFFRPPKMHLDTVGAIMNAAEATMEGLTAQTRIGLQYALEEHKTINVKLDLQAPLIIVPLDPTNWKSPVAILDAGHINVHSDLVDKLTIEEIKSKESYTLQDWERLNTLMYDQFNLHLQDAQFLVGPSIKTTMEQLHTKNPDLSAVVLDDLDIKLSLGVSILPESVSLARFKVNGEVPDIHVSLNDFQYKTIMQLLDVVIPASEGSESEESTVFHTFGDNSANKEIEHSDTESASSITYQGTTQRMMEANFTVTRIFLSFSRCLDATSLKTEHIVDIVGDSLAFLFYRTELNMHVDLSLQDINVVDHIERSGIPEFEKLVSSNNFLKEDGVVRKNEELFKVKYDRKLRIVEFKGKDIEVFDQDVDLEMSALKFVLSRKSFLSILNFVLNTFTDPNAEATPADEIKHDVDDSASPQKINVSVNLDSILVVLNEDGIKLATLQLSTALITVFLLPEEMDVRGKLGALSLFDDSNQGSPRDSVFRSLMSIEGDNLAEFTYKTYDPATNSELYQSSIDFVTAATNINFVEDAFFKIFSFLSKFQRMKAIYDSAREAAINQATQIETANQIKMNFLVKAPIIHFPRLVDPESDELCDDLVVELGDMYLTNEFKKEKEVLHNVISSGIKNVNVASKLNFDDNVVQEGKIINHLDINFEIDYVEEMVPDVTTCKVKGTMPEVDMELTEMQLRYIYNLQNLITSVMNFDDDNDLLDDIEEDAENANAAMKSHNKTNNGPRSQRSASILEIARQITSRKEDESDSLVEIYPKHKKFEVSFEIPRISMTLYNNTCGISDYNSKKLTTLAANKLLLDFTMTEDTHFNSQLSVFSFDLKDARDGTANCFTEIIPQVLSGKDQLLVQFSSSGEGSSRSNLAILGVEEPQTVLALDFIFELQAFVNKGLDLDVPMSVEPNDQKQDLEESDSDESLTISETKTENVPMAISLNVLKPSIILLADSTKPDTEALVFKVEEVLLSSQNIISLAINKVGMFVVTMDKFEDQRMRIIDDFSISFALDGRGSTAQELLTSIQLSVDPLLLRISFRDIRLAMKILDRANAYYEKLQNGSKVAIESGAQDPAPHGFTDEFKRRLSAYAPSSISSFVSQKTASKSVKKIQDPQILVKAEELEASFGGARLVLIGDVYELPVVDVGVKPFEAKVQNWSTELNAEVHFESYVNIYNYAKSVWEPLLEPWPVAVYASKTTTPKPSMMVEVVSRELAQFTFSSRSIALLSQISESLSRESTSKAREEITPYIIKNETGYDIEVWIDRNDGSKDKQKVVSNNGSINWEFEDWRTIRENLDTRNDQDYLGIRLVGSNYANLERVVASGEGEEIYMLEPPIDGIHNRLVCEITLRSDNIKVICIRSTVTILNNAESAIAVELVKNEQSIADAEFTIEPGQRRALPIDMVYRDTFKIKPSMRTQFNWSTENFDWRRLMKSGLALSCSTIGEGELSYYYFQAEAHYDKSEPLTTVYPHLEVVISAPIEIENLLPYDLDFRLYDKTAKKDWSGSISKGQNTFVQVATLKSLLLLSVEPKTPGFGKSEFAIINAPKESNFQKEGYTNVKHQDGQVVELKITYPTHKSLKTSIKVVISSPYLVLNRTGQNLVICDRAKPNSSITVGANDAESNKPHMFSFIDSSNTHSRALARVGGLAWSSPISFDAIGKFTGMSAALALNRHHEMNFGVSVAEGEGKYKLTRVVTFAPRYIIRNNLSEAIIVAESGSTKQQELASNESLPLYDLRVGAAKAAIIKFAHEGRSWSSPFAIDDIGQVFVKIQKENSGQVLVKVNIATEGATIFIQIMDANSEWPYLIKNYTETDFYIYQSNPNVNANNEVIKNDVDYKPIYYKVPAKSVMPYAYDYPNAVIKSMVVRSRGRERVVNLAEIGNLRPFRLPANQDQEQVIVDLNVCVDGPTQSLVITKYDPALSLYKLQDETTSNNNVSQTQFASVEQDDNYHTKIVTRLEGLGISLINARFQELCYASFRGVEVRYNESELYQNLSMKLKWIQLDNQLYGGIFPIIIYPTVVPKSGKEMNSHPSFSASVCRVKDDTHGVLFIKYATLLLQEMSIEVDEDFLFALIDFAKFPGASWNVETEDKLCDDSLTIPEPLSSYETSDIYFEALHLQPTLVNLSFVRTERVNAEDRPTLQQNPLMFFVNMLTMAIGNINEAPLTLNALFIENIRVPLPILLESIQTHYGQSFIYQLHKILGSADFLGNPVGLFNNISSGVLDIFYEPYNGLVMNDRPQEIGIGLAKGGLSFVKKSVFGFSDSFAKVTGSLAKGLAVATMDKQFQERRRLNQRRNRPKHALYGFKSGADSFFDSISSGVTGIASAPIEGAAKDGAGGFFKGLGKGFIGLPTKTAIGFFDLASNVSEGIRNTTTVFDTDGLEKVRLPRTIAYDHVIRSFSSREAQGQFWLKSLDGGKFLDQTYLAHLVLPGEEKAVLVTFEFILLFQINSMEISWTVTFDRVKTISLESTGLSIILKRTEGPFIPIPEKKSKMFLYEKIRIAVDQYNKHCQVAL